MTRLDTITQHFRRCGEFPVGHRIERTGEAECEAPGAYHDMVKLEAEGLDLDPAPSSVRADGTFEGFRRHTLIGTYQGDERQGELKLQRHFEGMPEPVEIHEESYWRPGDLKMLEYGGAGTDQEWVFASHHSGNKTVIYQLEKSDLDEWLS